MDALIGRYTENAETGCFEWNGSKNSNGYGKLKRHGKHVYAHRLAYELSRGEIPYGFTIDHLCRNRACCNPAHLEAVSLRENVRRSPRVAATHCARGHSLQGFNLFIDEDGTRKCRTCVSENQIGPETPLARSRGLIRNAGVCAHD